MVLSSKRGSRIPGGPLILSILVLWYQFPSAQGRISSIQQSAQQQRDVDVQLSLDNTGSLRQQQKHDREGPNTIRNLSTKSLQGESCGLFSECAPGLSCVKGPVGGGQCLPVDCLAQAIQTSNFDVTNHTHHLFTAAGITPQELALARAKEARSDQTFAQDSTAMADMVQVMNQMDAAPFRELQTALNTCFNQNNKLHNNTSLTTEATTPGTTMYYGFHIEGGALYDGSFSVLVALAENEPNLTFLRGCFGGGGVGFDMSAVIGIGYTGTRDDLMGCSTLLTDNELGIGFAFGVDVGIGFNGVVYLDFTLGVGLTGEGLGIGLCGNWPQ